MSIILEQPFMQFLFLILEENIISLSNVAHAMCMHTYVTRDNFDEQV